MFITGVSCVTQNGVGSDLPFEKDTDWFDASKYLGKKGHRYHTIPVKYALAALKGLQVAHFKYPERTGVFMGTATTDRSLRHTVGREIAANDSQTLGAAIAPNMSVNIASAIVAQKTNCTGPGYTFTGGDEVGMLSVWNANRRIISCDIDHAIVGQVEHTEDKFVSDGAILWCVSSRRYSDDDIEMCSVSMYPKINEKFLESVNKYPNSERCFVTLKQSISQSSVASALCDYQDIYESIEVLDNPSVSNESIILMLNLTQKILEKRYRSITILSSQGHIFNFEINHQEMHHE